MARQRRTLALIIICLPILATVIVAFRVRDLPTNLQDSFKSELKKQKCDDCDVNDAKDKHSVKIDSATKRHQKAPDKLSFKFIDDSADDDDNDDDDDDLELLKRETALKKEEHLKVAKVKKDGKDTKKESGSKKFISIDDDDDDDDEDDDDIPASGKKIKSIDGKKKLDSSKKHSDLDLKVKKSLPKKRKDDDDDDEDDDDGDELDLKTKSKKDTKLAASKEPKPKGPGKKLKVKDTDVDDEDDDDSEDNVKLKKSKSLKNIIESGDKQKEDKIKKLVKITKAKDKGDDDDDDDDDDESDEDDENIKELKKIAKPTIAQTGKPEKAIEKLQKKEHKSDKDDKKEQVELKAKKKEDKSEVKKAEPVKKDSKPVEKKDEKKEIKKPKESEKEVKAKEQKETKPKTETKEKIDKPKIVETKSKAGLREKADKFKAAETKKDHRKDKSVEMLLGSHESYTFKHPESRIQHVTDALQRRNLLQSEFEDFYAFFPTFAPNFSRIHNPECRRHGQILLRQLRGTKLWALNMLDATAKIPSGILQGNTIQLGDFDQCLNSRAKVQLETGSVVKVQGQYCLATLDVKAEHQELELPVHLAQGKNLIKSRLDDPGHFVPRFSTLSWGVCVPAACDPQDVEVVIKDAFKHYQHRSGFSIKVKVDEDDCHTEEGDWWEEWLELPTILTLSFYGIIILLVLIATLQDFLTRKKSDEPSEAEEEPVEEQKDASDGEEKEEKEAESKPSDGFLASFSLYRTIDKLVAPSTSDEIACIHGIRGVATIALLIAHKFLPLAVMPYTNRTKITEVVSSPLWSWARAGWMYTDCFLLLSGALTAHRMSDSDSGAPWRLFTRYLRLTPALLAVVLFYAYIWDFISDGPMWGSLVTKNVEVCEEGWWWNLLYVHNWFGFEEMCAPQTHQLALDMQLTILGGIIVWALQSEHIATKFLLPLLHVGAAYSRYSTFIDHRLTLIAYHGVTVSQLYRTARLSYTSILHRSTSYLVGLSLGLALRKPSQHGKLYMIFGWLVSIALWASVWWAGLDTGYTTYHYSVSFAAQYAALAPIASAIAIAWVIYAVHNSGSGFLYRMLCCRPLASISRLSYALYLCQFIVFLTQAGTVRTASEFSLFSLIDAKEISAILLSSTVLTVTFVIPMQSLHKIFSFSSKTDVQEENKEEEGDQETHEIVEEPEEKVEENHIEEVTEVQQVRNRPSFLAHREVLEEIPEAEVEFEIQRDKNDGLEEILEEEEDGEEMANHIDEEDLEIIEEEVEEGGEDFWGEREEAYSPRRSYVREDDGDEWEWTTNGGSGRGAQFYRYSR